MDIIITLQKKQLHVKMPKRDDSILLGSQLFCYIPHFSSVFPGNEVKSIVQ